MLKRFLLLLIAVTIGTGAVVFFFLQQATYLPSWYQNQAASTGSSKTHSPQTGENQYQKKLESEEILKKISQSLENPNNPGEAKIDSQELNTLIETGLVSTPNNQLKEAVKATNTEISEGKILSGAVIDLNQVPIDKLPSKAQNSIEKLITTIPGLKERPLYIGVEGKPSVRNRKVVLDNTTRVKLGNISMTIPELSQRLGIPEEKLNRQLSNPSSAL
ncbi:hypothetical protein [Mastigocoleus testarum]|uniref:Uncharacterized protein n=1 Tax=Mastigocoleus testarum BC008 TaxID=371196 RepID=A0A0V7ZXC5_9CYAN|nr:hypothetical protein [Mastigocoleus testarum]KST68883.1 hypothetical protein BC008_02075 [Mastigocoleus testarum BC008]KST68902.1 hypothetical protein BC008_02170 [Mastigocoleus testarum BC008]